MDSNFEVYFSYIFYLFICLKYKAKKYFNYKDVTMNKPSNVVCWDSLTNKI